MVLIEAINDCNRTVADVSALLREAPESINEVSQGSGYSALHFLAYNNDCKKAGALLDCITDAHRLQRLFSRVSSTGQTFVHVAGNENSIAFLRLAYSRKQALVAGMINDQDGFGHTAISLASGNNHKECLELLLSFENAMEGLTVHDKWGRLPIQVASQHGSTSAFDFLKKYYIDVLDDIDMREGLTEHGLGLGAETREQMSSLASELQVVLGARRRGADDAPAAAPSRERGIFDFAKGASVALATTTTTASSSGSINSRSSSSRNSSAPTGVALSKLIEYPVDSEAVASMINDEEMRFNLAGRDMSGMTALHKLASWNDSALLALLLAKLSAEELMENRNPGQQTALHVAVEMGAFDACQLLAADPRIDLQRRDRQGRTAKELAEHLGYFTFAAIL